MSFVSRCSVVSLVVARAICGGGGGWGGGGGGGGGSGEEVGEGGPGVDAPPDAAPPMARIVILGGGKLLSSWTYFDTSVGQHADATFVVRNDGDAATGPLALAS